MELSGGNIEGMFKGQDTDDSSENLFSRVGSAIRLNSPSINEID